MKSRIPFFLAALLCCIFFSCAAQTEKDNNSSLSFSVPESSIRAATSGASGDWSLRISISGGFKLEKTYPIKTENLQDTQTFLLENLPDGVIINIDSYIYCGDLCYFKSKETKSIVLSEGTNSVDIVLTRDISSIKSPCVWQKYYILNNNPTQSFNQISDYDNNSDSSELNSNYISTYCFDKNLNLWTAESSATALKKYTLQVSDGLYSTSYTSLELPGETAGFSLYDICYDTATQYIFLLFIDASNGLLYAMDSNSNFITYDSGFTLDSEDSDVYPVIIAVYDGTIYAAGSNNAIYKATVSVGTEVAAGNFSKIATIDESYLDGYDSSKHDTLYDSFYITDLQIGDGAGNDTGTIYALVKESTRSLQPSRTNFFSRGALIEINTSGGTPKVYGWTTTTQEISTTAGSKILYSPEASDSFTGFFGPARFAAVVPKKIVVLDDGIAYSGSGSNVNNKDGFVEFDIAGKTFSRGASVTATKPSVYTTSYPTSYSSWLSVN